MMTGEYRWVRTGAAEGRKPAAMRFAEPAPYRSERIGVEPSQIVDATADMVFQAIFLVNTVTMVSAGGGGTAATQIIEG